MFESNMDEYLDEEVEFINQSFDAICRTWEKQACIFLSLFVVWDRLTLGIRVSAK